MTKKLNKSKKAKAYEFANRGKTVKRNRLLHFMRRFHERHGYILSVNDVDEILMQIKEGSAELISKDRKGFVYKVHCRKKDIAVVVAPCKKELVTTYKLEEKHYRLIEQNKLAKSKQKVIPLHRKNVVVTIDKPYSETLIKKLWKRVCSFFRFARHNEIEDNV